MYSSTAIVIEGDVLVGAARFNFKPALVTALEVVGPKAAMIDPFCVYSGKFLNREATPEGLKKINISYLSISTFERLLATVL